MQSDRRWGRRAARPACGGPVEPAVKLVFRPAEAECPQALLKVGEGDEPGARG